LLLGAKSAGSPLSFGGIVIFAGDRDGTAPPDARSLARHHLREINKRIDTTLNDKKSAIDDTTRAHLEECHESSAKILGASMQVNE
jgi:hypothetical protein